MSVNCFCCKFYSVELIFCVATPHLRHKFSGFGMLIGIVFLQPTDAEPKSHKSQKGKQDTPSLKLTFKRAPSGAYNDHHSEEAPATL